MRIDLDLIENQWLDGGGRGKWFGLGLLLGQVRAKVMVKVRVRGGPVHKSIRVWRPAELDQCHPMHTRRA